MPVIKQKMPLHVSTLLQLVCNVSAVGALNRIGLIRAQCSVSKTAGLWPGCGWGGALGARAPPEILVGDSVNNIAYC